MTEIKFSRFDVINFLIKNYNYKKYLEIGVQYAVAWNNVICDYKIGVEPIHDHADPRINKLYSNEFFNINKETFDIIFIDGDHNYAQVINDIRNAKMVLNPGGSIVLHDCRPLTEEFATNPLLNGTVWRAVCEIVSEPGWNICTLNDDHGVGVLREGKMQPLPINPHMSYQEFEKNRVEILNLKDEEPFKKFFTDSETYRLIS
jgi:SAM-dependent methyltransferase